MLNFAMGPVQSNDTIRKIGSQQVPYFRTSEFSEIMLENESLIKKLAGAEAETRAVFLTGSGTAAMEAVVMNLFTNQDRLLVINGGSFGQRFVELCEIHKIPFSEIKIETGVALTNKMLADYEDKNYTGFLVNLHETSTGVYYDPILISNFCKRNHMVLVVDAISSFLADPFSMAELGVDVMITSSQKVLACPPGISVILLSSNAVKTVEKSKISSMYFDLKNALANGERGQTPFTPAVGILLQINARLRQIDAAGGAKSEIERISFLSRDFRSKIKDLPLKITSQSMSNAMTPLHPINVPADQIFEILKDQYEIWVCPNGGKLKKEIFRVGHIGALTADDNRKLLDALQDMYRHGLL